MKAESSQPDAHRLASALFATLEHDYSEIGEKMHDALCQTLCGSGMLVKIMTQHLEAGRAVEAAELRQLTELLDRSLDEVRALSQKLCPLQDDPAALMTALERLARTTSMTGQCEFQCEDPFYFDEPAAALTLYRIAEKAVKNALEHALLSRITISLAERDARIVLTIRDDGRGFINAPPPHHVADAWIMNCRAKSVGAELTIDTDPAGGTCVTCSLPKRKCRGQRPGLSARKNLE